MSYQFLSHPQEVNNFAVVL